MLKFQQLNETDKEKRYTRIMNILYFLGVVLFPSYITFSLFGLVLVFYILMDLFFFGYLNKKEGYHLSSFFTDILSLSLIGLIVTYRLVPSVMTILFNGQIDVSGSLWTELLKGSLAILLVYLFWNGLIYIEKKLISRCLGWKREATSFFNKKKKKFD